MEFLLRESSPIPIEFPPMSNIYSVYIDSGILLKHVQIELDIQRDLDRSWLGELKSRILKNHAKKGYFHFGVFEVACMNSDLYLINGQHRYYVLKDLHEQFGTFKVEVKLYTAANVDELNHLWMTVNGSKPSKLCQSVSKQVIINSVRKWFTEKYPKYLTDADRPMKPLVNLDKLEEELIRDRVIETLDVKSAENMISMIEKINQYYRYVDDSKWKAWKIDESLVYKCRIKDIASPLFLGIFAQFEWLKRLVEVNKSSSNIINYSSIPHLAINSKSRKISKAKRRRVWQKRNNKNSLLGKCFVCKCSIDYDTFESGHIVSHFWGGSTSLDNLEPICSICNKDMGVENLLKYKNENFTATTASST